MKRFASIILIGIVAIACDEEPQVEVIDSSMPQGTFTEDASGSFVEQNDTGSTGTAAIGMDSEGTEFLKFGSDFETNLGTGTVTVFFSDTNDEMAIQDAFTPGNYNLVGVVNANGEQYFKLDDAPSSDAKYVILWCASARILFGYAELQ